MARTARKVAPVLPPTDASGRVIFAPRVETPDEKRARRHDAISLMATLGKTEGERQAAHARLSEIARAQSAPDAPPPALETVSAPPPPVVTFVNRTHEIECAECSADSGRPVRHLPPVCAPRPRQYTPAATRAQSAPDAPPPATSDPSTPASAPAWSVLATMRGVEIRERAGVIYCTCPDWLASAMNDAKPGPNGRPVGNPAAGKCRHLDMYRGNVTPDAPPLVTSAPPPPAPTAGARKTPSAPASAPAATRAPAGSSASTKGPPPPPPDTRPVATLRRDADTGAQWLQFPEKPDKPTREALKDPAYRWKWHDDREQWYNGPKAKIPGCIRVVDGGACYYAREKRGTAPQTPPPAPQTPAGPIKIARVKITFTEARDVSGVRLATYPSLAACSDALRKLANGAPAPGRGYAKTELTIEWSDGESATVKIDLNARHADYVGNLAADEARVLWTWAAKSGDARAARLLTSYQLD